ncbi:MAG TPA: nucleoside hydrolase [Candidatus Acidoferrum sp.]|nr:nucleoside hydrolase [Candidatus Acidoferrum sp.]
MLKKRNAACFMLAMLLSMASLPLPSRSISGATTASQNLSPVTAVKNKIILDTDIGDDVDDAFALALALSSPELEISAITTAWGDTALRARLVDRFLAETGHPGIAVAEGIPTHNKTPFSQARWAQAAPQRQAHPQAVDLLLRQIRENPGEITLVAIGPLTNIGAAIDQDAATFRKLKRVVLMGGSIRRGYGDLGYAPDRGPAAEYNIASDVPAAQKLFASGAPIFMMPLDSTQLKLDEVKRSVLFSAATPLTNALAALYYQWGQQTPTPRDLRPPCAWRPIPSNSFDFSCPAWGSPKPSRFDPGAPDVGFTSGSSPEFRSRLPLTRCGNVFVFSYLQN